MSEKVISLAKRKLNASGPALCMACKHEWEGRAAAGDEWLLCPQCGLEKGRFRYPHDRGDLEHWHCHCGNALFYATPNGLYCPNCGAWQGTWTPLDKPL